MRGAPTGSTGCAHTACMRRRSASASSATHADGHAGRYGAKDTVAQGASPMRSLGETTAPAASQTA
jgi:hypothetical protein